MTFTGPGVRIPLSPLKNNIKNELKEHNEIKEDKRLCLNCGKEINSRFKNAKFCCQKCSSEHIHKKAYIDFLTNPEKYCNGGYTPKAFKEEFMKEQNYICAMPGCNQTPIHNGKPLVFILDHIDGNSANNRRENLRMICPNCDTQLDTYKSKNKNSTRRNYWKEHIYKTIGIEYSDVNKTNS